MRKEKLTDVEAIEGVGEETWPTVEDNFLGPCSN